MDRYDKVGPPEDPFSKDTRELKKWATDPEVLNSLLGALLGITQPPWTPRVIQGGAKTAATPESIQEAMDALRKLVRPYRGAEQQQIFSQASNLSDLLRRYTTTVGRINPQKSLDPAYNKFVGEASSLRDFAEAFARSLGLYK